MGYAYASDAGVNVTINDTNVEAASQISVESISWNGSGTPYTENLHKIKMVVDSTELTTIIKGAPSDALLA